MQVTAIETAIFDPECEGKLLVVDRTCGGKSHIQRMIVTFIGGIIGMVVASFKQFLKEQRGSEDKWIATCANFLEISFDFSEFVKAYHLGDAVAIECGYQKHVPVWQEMGQHKSVEIHHSQQELLYRDNQFSILKES